MHFVEEARRMATRLAELDRRCVVFGASRHRHRFAPPLSTASVEAFEAAIGARLPEGYRAFVTELGNGGAGPEYGVMPLEAPGAHLGRAFRWRDEFTIDENGLDAPVDGTITVAEHGCGIFALLVVRGEGAGSVWVDARYERGVVPTGKSFERWWLDGMGRQLALFERVMAMMEARTPHEEIHRALEPGVLQLHVDEAMLSLMDRDPQGRPKVLAKKPWGVACGLVEEHYGAWRARR